MKIPMHLSFEEEAASFHQAVEAFRKVRQQHTEALQGAGRALAEHLAMAGGTKRCFQHFTSFPGPSGQPAAGFRLSGP